MTQRQTYGVPQITPPSVQDPAMNQALQEMARQMTFWLGQMQNRVDQQAGVRGSPEVHADIDLRGNRIKNVAIPVEDGDGVPFKIALTIDPVTQTYDVKNVPLTNVPIAVNRADAVPLEQIEARILNALGIATAINTPPNIASASVLGTVLERFAREDHTHGTEGNATVTGTFTFDLDPAAPFVVTAGSAVVTNLDADKVDGQDRALTINADHTHQSTGAQGGQLDHGAALTGLTDDDHTQYLLADGSRALSGDWDAGSVEIRAQTLESDVTTGTSPLTIASTTVVTNLNADQLDGKDYTTGSFTVTGTGFSVDPTGTATYVLMGEIVVLFIPTLTGTSDDTTFTLTGMPAAITPTESIWYPVRAVDNGTEAFRLLELVGSSTTINLYPDPGGGSWTNSGTKTLQACTIIYNIL